MSNYDIDQVWKEVLNSTNKLRGRGPGKKLILKYGDLRTDLMRHFCKNNAEFDEMFCILMKSKYGVRINLHGTLVGEYKKHKNLLYRGRLYPFFSIS